MVNPATPHLLYLIDPLCGWCYGATPMLQRLANEAGMRVELGVTGLFAGQGARPMDAAFASYAWANDQRIAALSGQPFSPRYKEAVLDQAQGMLDSGPATLALSAVALSAPASELDALRALQQARYVQGRDITSLAVLAEVLDGLHFNAAAQRLRQPDAQLQSHSATRMSRGRQTLQALGAQGVPTLVLRHAQGQQLVPSGLLYGPFDTLVKALHAALAKAPSLGA